MNQTRSEQYRQLKRLALSLGRVQEVKKLWRQRGATTKFLRNEFMVMSDEYFIANFGKIDIDIIINQAAKGKIHISENNANKIFDSFDQTNRDTLKITLKNGDVRFITAAIKSKDFIISVLTSFIWESISAEHWGSDTLDEYKFEEIDKIEIIQIRKKTKTNIDNKSGGFFNYVNTTELNLARYQIFTEKQIKISIEKEKKQMNSQSPINNHDVDENKRQTQINEQCLIHCLYLAGVRPSKINNVKLAFIEDGNEKGTFIRKNDIKKISDMIERQITIYKYDKKNNRTRVQTEGKNHGDVVEIAIYENHYFLYEKTKYSKYFINNYEMLKDLKDALRIVRIRNQKGKIYYKRSDEPCKYINSLEMVKILFNKGYFKKSDIINYLSKSVSVNNKKIYLDNIKNEQRLFENKEKKKEEFKIFYADTETFVGNTEHHKLYLLGVVSHEKKKPKIYNVCDFKASRYKTREQNLLTRFLDNITENKTNNAVVYFHNLKYDYFITKKYLNICNVCEKGGQYYSITIFHGKCKVEFKDSFKLMSVGLAKFPDIFELDKKKKKNSKKKKKYSKKEAIAYEYYTQENNNKICRVEEYESFLTVNERRILRVYLKEDGEKYDYNKNNQTFNPTKYYIDYLKMDCIVLKKGLKKFDKIVRELTVSMSIYDYLTISSLTDAYMKKNGAYEGVYEVSGNLRDYISHAVYGGRVCANDKYKKKIIESKISDYDGVSLYPSAIYRLCDEYGLAVGEAKKMEQKEIKNWENFNYSIMTVKIHKVNKFQQIPFIAHRGDNSIKYLNKPTEKNIVIDKYTLQDWIKFHEIEYDIVDGVYWNSGYNKKMGELIKNLFESRLKYKKTKPALANIIKLMLNSAYGKTCIKKTKTKKIIMSKDKYKVDKKTGEKVIIKDFINNYLYNNYNTIKKYSPIGNYKMLIEMEKSDDSYNRSHIGCAILSMSKRIMNEVFNTFNKLKCPVYYTDTDSIHCNYNDVEKVEEQYKKDYNGRILNGKFLGQFHIDFDLQGSAKGADIYATKSIFLGKKCYIDMLESKNDKGETIHGVHYRLKGVTKEGIISKSKKFKSGLWGMYKSLAQGTKMEFILNPYDEENNKKKVMFEYYKDVVRTRKEFTRTLKF